MSDQYVNKVIVNGKTRIDLSGDTVDSSSLLLGVTAHDKSGKKITGTISDKTIDDVTIQNNHIIIPPGVYSKGIDIALKDWTWDPLVFGSSLVTDSTGAESITEID